MTFGVHIIIVRLFFSIKRNDKDYRFLYFNFICLLLFDADNEGAKRFEVKGDKRIEVGAFAV